ncbi:uncharacterized protein LOC111284494 [Durio zibethinus]|uniref:Uncharacterized protein LOC111284494 n=1 Tax=Durio zibethinus TaxID=66656 RepID=A0A6P5XL10_DURZI|nr:uncharacterized protein LOC111284494 [Durio zibethinus]
MAPCNVNSDLLFEILSRMELKTMRRYRILSRECNSLTYESSFMRLHCQRTKTIAGYFVQSLRSNRYHSTFLSIDNPGLDPGLSLDFLPDRSLEILATVDQGLMFCMNQGPENRHYICKPSTRQWEVLPSPNSRYFTRKTAMVVLRSDPLRFKIVRLSDGEYNDSELELENSKPEVDDYDYKRFQVEIFDSKIWAWEQLDDLMLSYDEFFNSKPAVSAYGGLHWLTSNKEKNNILSFYEDTESWELVSLPNALWERYWYSVNLTEYEGKLAFICVSPDFIELWVQNYYGEKFWTKRDSINLKSFNQKIGHSSANSFYNADILFMNSLFSAIFYNFKTGQFNRLELPLKHMHIDSAFFIQTDSKPIRFRQHKKSFASNIFTLLIFVVFLLFIFDLCHYNYLKPGEFMIFVRIGLRVSAVRMNEQPKDENLSFF